MTRCAACGAESAEGYSFCRRCGAPLGSSCPGCGEPVESDDLFCGRCGAELGTSTALPVVRQETQHATQQLASPDTQPLAERRVCSVLFADLVGFTPLSESRDPEDVRAILSRYFEVARTVITRYGGVVEKFIGDAVMAVWGAPVATEGDTERAVRAALELVNAVEALGGEVGAPDLSARAGVVTGEVAVSIGARGEGMVAGDAVNTASRVQAVARPGSVFVDEATKSLSQSAISFEDEGAHELKGKESAQHLHRAVRVLSLVGGNQRSDGLEAPFIGRELELRSLKDLFHASMERRAPRLLVVSGPAGVGKSRLGWEFEKYLDGLADTVLWHRGRCLSYGEGVAFWALSEIVRQRFGIAEEDTTEAAAAKLHEGMVRFVPDEQEREFVGIRLARLLGVPYVSDTRTPLGKEELFAGWRVFFERLAQVAPVVVLVEDAQHADEGLLQFFEHLIEWSRDLPIFALFFARPGLDRIDSGFGVGRNRSSISLDRLDDASMAKVVDSLVPGMPPQAREAITTHAQGIPLFALETVRSLIDRGVVVREGESYRLAGDIGDLVVPDSLHALLAARLDALSAEVRSLVADASVLGTSFSRDALVAISTRDAGEVEEGLEELLRRDVLEVFTDPLSPQRGAYRFGQEMLRQVAYQTLSRKDRKTRHLAVAAHLRAVFANDGEEIAEVVARHYLDALAAGQEDGDAEANTAEARHFLVRAGERAERSGAPQRAQASYAEAAAIAEPEQAAGLYERASLASLNYGDLETAIAQADAAREGYLALGEERAAARVRTRKGTALVREGRFDAGRAELREAVDVLMPEPDQDTVEALRRLAGAETLSGNPDSDRLASEALILGQELDVDTALLAGLFATRGTAASVANRPAEAVAYYERAARLAEQVGDLGTAANALLNLADDLTSTDPLGAADAARSAAAHSRRGGRHYDLAYATANLSVALLEHGDWDEAEAAVVDALAEQLVEDELVRAQLCWIATLRGDADAVGALFESLPRLLESEDPQTQTKVRLLKALAATVRGDAAEVLAETTAALALSDALGIRHENVRWAWPLAARAARSLRDDAALDSLVAMLDAHPIGHVPPGLRASRSLARALRSADRGEAGAAPLLAAAVTALRAATNPYHLAHGLVDQAEHFVRVGESRAAEAALAEAREIATKLRCSPLSRRVEAVSAEPARLS